MHDVAEKEAKLRRMVRSLNELRLDPATHAAILSQVTDLRSALDAISKLKYHALEAKQKTECEIEQHEEEEVRPAKLPQLSLLPSAVEELQQKIALHSVSSVP